MTGSSIAARLADWITATRYEDLPRRVSEEAKNQILSMIAAVHAGHFSEAGRLVSRAVRESAGGKEATLIPSGERTTVQNAIFGNTALSMALDFDDYLFAGHTGHSSVLAGLAVAEKLGSGGRDFIAAQVLANEVAGRVGAAVLFGPLNGQMCGFLHLIGAVVLAAKLLKLDRQQTQNAFSIALLQPNLCLQPTFFGSEAKILIASTTAPVGVKAAELAASGLQGADDVFEGEAGFLQRFTPEPLVGAFEGLGRAWLTETLSYKLYPGCAYIHAAIDCILALARQHHVDAKAVRAVHIAATPLTLAMEGLSAPYVRGPESLPTTLNFSMAYCAAAALTDRELTARQFSRDRVRDAAIWQLAAKVQLSSDEDLTRRMRDRSLLQVVREDTRERYTLNLAASDPTRFAAAFGARVRIEMEDGRGFEMEQEIPLGGAGRPPDERRRAVEEKFRRETRYTLRKERMEKAIDLIHHLDDPGTSHLRELVRTSCSEKV